MCKVSSSKGTLHDSLFCVCEEMLFFSAYYFQFSLTNSLLWERLVPWYLGKRGISIYSTTNSPIFKIKHKKEFNVKNIQNDHALNSKRIFCDFVVTNVNTYYDYFMKISKTVLKNRIMINRT